MFSSFIYNDILLFFLKLSTDENRNERGRILISLLYSNLACSFYVRIIRGSQLLPMDFGQTSDPYCKLLLYPSIDKNTRWHFKTTIKKNTLQPEFNEEFVFSNIKLQELINKTLQITVYDKDIGKKDDCIGKDFFILFVKYQSRSINRLKIMIEFHLYIL